jgi:uncharacterized protein
VDLVVLADTHLKGGIDPLDVRVHRALRRADLILHAGDFVSPKALSELAEFAEVLGVLGNNDAAMLGMLPETVVVDVEGVRIAMVHDSGQSTGRAARLARRFPGARLVVFGHSHIPWNAPGSAGQLLFNPGSPTQRRTQPARTFGRLRLEGGKVVRREIVSLD